MAVAPSRRDTDRALGGPLFRSRGSRQREPRLSDVAPAILKWSLRWEIGHAFHQMSLVFEHVVSHEREASVVIVARSPLIKRAAIFPLGWQPEETRLLDVSKQGHLSWT